MYAKCSDLAKARGGILEDVPFRDVAYYNALIGGYARQGQCENALDCVDQMWSEVLSPDVATYICSLKACGKAGTVYKGRAIHGEIVYRGFLDQDIELGTAVVDMYAKCDALIEAHLTLKALPVRNVVAWNALIAGYSRHGECSGALACVESMRSDGLRPNKVTFVSIVRACGSKGDTEKGKQIHGEIVSRGLLEKDIVLGNALVDMYAKCGAMRKAHGVLEELPIRDTVTWNSLIAGYVQGGQGESALDCLERMQSECTARDAITFTCTLRACCIARNIEKGKMIHGEILSRGLSERDGVLGNALVEMYAKCGWLARAQRVLEEGIAVRNVVSWSTLIAGYTREGRGEDAVGCFERMRSEGLSPDLVIYVHALKACGLAGAMGMGRRIHDEVVCRGLMRKDNVLGNAVVDMYAKCGALLEARRVLMRELPARDAVSWNSLIAGYARSGESADSDSALNALEEMRRDEGVSPDAVTFICCLRACASLRAIDQGERIHEQIVRESLLLEDAVLGAALVGMYAKCGSLAKARHVLEELPLRDASAWNAVIAGHAQDGQSRKALVCFETMEAEGVSPSAVTLICTLGACGMERDVEKGKRLHSEALSRGLLTKDAAVGNALVDAYARCGAFAEARMVMKRLPVQGKVAWNALVAGYASEDRGEDALECFERMQEAGLAPDAASFASALKACSSAGRVDKGRQMHRDVLARGLLRKDVALGNALLDMYAKCGELEKARDVLEELPVRNAVSWNALITGYAEGDRGEDAWSLYMQMQSEGLAPDEVTMLSVLKACASAADVGKGKRAHGAMASRGWPADPALGNALVDMYAKCNALAEAQRAFDALPNRTVVACNALISGYARQGRGREALSWYATMQSQGALQPDTVTFIYVCKACGDLGAARQGERAHDEIVRRGLLLDGDAAALGNAVVGMYARCGMLEKAREVLDQLPARDAVSWNALLGGLVQERRARAALDCLEQMRSEGLRPDPVSFLWALKACESIGAPDKGERIHGDMLRARILEKDGGGLLRAALVGMYARCGLLGKAEEVLKDGHDDHRASVSWNALIRGYAEQGQWHRALACFEPMLLQGICGIDAATFVCMLKACASTGAVVVGERIHGELVRSGFLSDDDPTLATALIDMYAKCGRLRRAEDLLRGLRVRDQVSWSALIAGYAQRGRARRALDCFGEMKVEGFAPDEITFSSLLSACARSGLLDQAQMLFRNMAREYGIAPSLEHLTCILAVFGYAGRLDEAVAMLGAMPASSDRPEAWLALLGACKKSGNVDVAGLAFARARALS